MTEQRLAYFVLEGLVDRLGNYIPCIAKEGERGYYLTDWNYGNSFDRAVTDIDKLNKRLGLLQEDVDTIIASTM
jgi:hypothetical protein